MNSKFKTGLIAAMVIAVTAITSNDLKFKNSEKMITVKVTYGVKKAFAAQNKANIALFMKDLKAMNSSDFKYEVYTLKDETTFVHISSYANGDIQQKVLNTPSFKEFQRQRDESGLTKAHNIEEMSFIASSQND